MLETRRRFHEELNALESEILGLGERAELALSRAVDGLVDTGGAADREVVGLGAAAREHDLRRLAADQRGDGRSRLVDEGLRLLAEMMHARRVAEDIPGGAPYGVGDFRRDGCRRVVVKVDTHSEPFIVA